MCLRGLLIVLVSVLPRERTVQSPGAGVIPGSGSDWRDIRWFDIAQHRFRVLPFDQSNTATLAFYHIVIPMMVCIGTDQSSLRDRIDMLYLFHHLHRKGQDNVPGDALLPV